MSRDLYPERNALGLECDNDDRQSSPYVLSKVAYRTGNFLVCELAQGFSRMDQAIMPPTLYLCVASGITGYPQTLSSALS